MPYRKNFSQILLTKMKTQIILRAKDVQRIMNVCKTDSYSMIKEIKEDYPYSKKLKGSKIRTEDLAHCYDLKMDEISLIGTSEELSSPPS